MSLSVIVLVVLCMVNLSYSIVDIPPVYAGSINFQELLANASAGGNQNSDVEQLDEVFSGLIGGDQLDEAPTFGPLVQAAVDNFDTQNINDITVDFPEFGQLTDILSGFGFSN
eukprot:TRINITY_DN2231_c0_g1_i6.p1 TRINITY_DN2231_c0_g1~~TRINITY_DN2231_c0_g1_i6.p1  ORF type:complete len:113 (+),score=23.64 TRINITY_DN2231_c0_g1_i6:95-433(+)